MHDVVMIIVMLLCWFAEKHAPQPNPPAVVLILRSFYRGIRMQLWRETNKQTPIDRLLRPQQDKSGLSIADFLLETRLKTDDG